MIKKITPYIIGVAVLIIVLFLINPSYIKSFFSQIFKSTEEPAQVKTEIGQRPSPVIQFKTITDSDSEGKWKFSATYPVFDETLGKKWSTINSQIEAEIQVIKLQTTDSLSQNISPENVPPTLTPFGITITSDATTSDDFGTVSVIYSTFVDGGLLAHPYTNFESHTFSINDGIEKQLADFFNTSDFLDRLSKNSTVKLKDYYSSAGNSDTGFLNNNEGLLATSTNFGIFMLSNESLILQFAEYQLGSRPYGAPRIEIPFSALIKV